MAGVVERLKEWIEATEAVKSFATKYVTGGFMPRTGREKAPEKTVSRETVQELDELRRIEREKWEAYRQALGYPPSQRL